MRNFGVGILFAIPAYVLGAFVGYWGIIWFSGNAHDRSMEASMTAAFFFGPLAAVAGLAAGIVWSARRAKPKADGASPS